MKFLIISLFLVNASSVFGQVKLNEMQSSNNSTIADNMGDFDDWIEIHNPTSDTIDIGGLVLKDQVDTWAIPLGNAATVIPPGGLFLLWADDQEFQGSFHTNFKLASGGEFLGLYESDSTTVIDSITIPAINANDSYTWCNTGWTQTNSPTPLVDNNCTVSVTENTNSNDDCFISVINQNQVKIELLESSPKNNFITIYSLDGKIMMQELLTGQQTVLDLSTLKHNIYLITISTPNFIHTEKIVL